MSKAEELKTIVARMLMVSPDDIDSRTTLKALATSLGNARIRLALKRLGLSLPAGAVLTTFGALVATVSGEEDLAAPQSQVVSSGNISISEDSEMGDLPVELLVGIDVEDIRSLPMTSDFWEDEFYRATFARSEIAYAILQPEPKAHFAGFWCAKEALRKCDPAFNEFGMGRIAVAHDPTGRPYLTAETDSGVKRLSHVLSISHTTEVATAVVILAHNSGSSQMASTDSAPVPISVEKKSWQFVKFFSGK